MNTIDWVKVAEAYLKGADAYESFMNQLRDDCKYDVDFAEWVLLDPKRFILSAFVWARTVEGHEYWKRLHFAWASMYDVING